jgi:5'-methylthioadenosine phosphorylase
MVGIEDEIDVGPAALFQRHGLDGYTLPDRIDHVANMRAVAEAGCDRVLAVSSVGGLRRDLGPGTFLCPDDFIAPGPSPSAFDDERAHRVAGFNDDWRAAVVAGWRRVCEPPLVDGGIYWQTSGPRFETQAEVRMLAERAQVVGMTIGSECTVAGELGLAYAAICVVDNLANGVGEAGLTMEELTVGRIANREALRRELEMLVPELASEPRLDADPGRGPSGGP